MSSKTMGKNILIVVAGVMAAGFIMNQMRNNGLVDQVRSGYGA